MSKMLQEQAHLIVRIREINLIWMGNPERVLLPISPT